MYGKRFVNGKILIVNEDIIDSYYSNLSYFYIMKSPYQGQFWLLCISNFLFTSSFQMIIPELPSHLASMHGEQYIGYIIALFTLTAGLSRPFSGKLTDTIGRIPIMAIGSVVCFFCSIAYPYATTVFSFLLLRFVHGFSTGTKPTATAAFVADIIPEHKRGEAAGYLGIFTAIGMSVGPAFGSFLTDAFGIQWLWWSSAIFALLSILILLQLKETLPSERKEKFSWTLFKINRRDIFDKDVLIVFWIMTCISFATGAVLTIISDQTKSLGITNKGYYFLIYTTTALLSRLFFAKTSDKHGRPIVMIWAAACIAVSMFLLAFVPSVVVFSISGVLFGFGFGMGSPTLTAWTIDLSQPQNRGRAIATMYIGLELGIGLGALISGYIYQGHLSKIPYAYSLSAMLATVGLYMSWKAYKN
jgi:MFS family permease